MKPEIVERPELLLAGVISCGEDVGEIDIHGLWGIYNQTESSIPDQVEDAWFELHVGKQLGKGIYTVMVGVEIPHMVELPPEVSLKTVPGGRYAHFTHRMGDGSYGDAFARINAWVQESGTEVKDFGLQRYGSEFDPEDEDSSFQIFIPLA